MCLTEIKKTKYNISEALSPRFGVLGFMFACHLQQGGADLSELIASAASGYPAVWQNHSPSQCVSSLP